MVTCVRKQKARSQDPRAKFLRYSSLIHTMNLLPGFNTLNDKPNRLVVVHRKPHVAGDVRSIHLVQQRSGIISSRCLSNAISQAPPSDELSHDHVAMWHCASGALRSVTCTWLRRFLARKLLEHYPHSEEKLLRWPDHSKDVDRSTQLSASEENIVAPFYLCPPGTLSGGLAYTVAGFVDPRTTFVHFQRTPNAQDVFLHCAI